MLIIISILNTNGNLFYWPDDKKIFSDKSKNSFFI